MGILAGKHGRDAHATGGWGILAGKHGRDAHATLNPFQIDHQQIFFEILGVRDDLAVGIEYYAVAVKHEFIIAADLIDIDQRTAELPDLRRKKLKAKFVFVDDEGRRAGIDHYFRAGGVERGNRVLMIQAAGDHLFVVPKILANRNAGGQLTKPNEIGSLISRARLEIAALVKYVVCR